MGESSKFDLSPVAGVTVLYNPDREVVENIKSYIGPLEWHFVVDNSDRRGEEWRQVVEEIKRFPKVVYLDPGENRGIGFGLNWGAKEGVARGAKLLLTMDQDSRFEDGGIERLLACFRREVERDPRLAILSPFHYTLANRPIYDPNKGVEEVYTIMTSGNLLRLDIWEKLGGFKSEFFMDMIDIDFSLRLQREGFKIKVCHSVKLYHSMGCSKPVKLLWKTLYTPQYPPTREYYRLRNGLRLVFSNLTPFSEKISLLKHWFVKIILLAPFEDSFPKKPKTQRKGYLLGNSGLSKRPHRQIN